MIEFTFTDANGGLLFISQQQPTKDCGGGCCFDRAVEEFRRKRMPDYAPGLHGVIITVKGANAYWT